MQRQVDSQEFSEWLAFNAIEPIGELRADIRAATISHVVASTFSKNTPALKEFLIDYWSIKGLKKMQPEEMLTVFKRSARKR